MLRTVPRTALRQSALPLRAQRLGMRYQSTGFAKRRSFKNTFVRWGIAVGGIYWYNTSPIFNEPPAYTIQNTDSEQDEVLPTIAAVAATSRFRPPHPSEAPIVPSTPTANSPPSINPKSPDPRDPNAPTTVSLSGEQAVQSTDPDSLHQEAAQQGAFNEETGEINWDCPCLGGMAHGPCGLEFRDAFSCFVYSDKEPKGIDCIENFEKMQTCFRAHPEIYASEIEDDENTQRELEAEVAGKSSPSSSDMPDVDQPSVWTPVSDAEQPTTATPAKPASESPLKSSSADTNAPPAKLPAKSNKKSVYDAPDAEKLPASSPSNPTHKVSGTEPKAPASSKDTAVAAGKKVKEQFNPDKSADEAEQLIPKAAHDAR